MFLLLSGQTDITDRLSFCSSHLCFPWTEKLPSVVCLFLCSGLFTSFVPKDNRTEQECVFICSLLCVFTQVVIKQKTHLVYSITLIISVFRFQFQYVSSKVYFLRFSSTFLFPRNLDLTLSNVQMYLLEAD